MKFRNYCVIVMNANSDVIDEINQICETVPNILDGKGIVIATFMSPIEPNELKDWFMLNNRNFMFFELDSETSGFNIVKKEIHEALFGFLKNMDSEAMLQKRENFLKEIKTSIRKDINSEVNKMKELEGKISNIKESMNIVEDLKMSKIRKLSENDIQSMTDSLKLELSNDLIDYGVRIGFDKLTDIDKKILQLLTK